jgi:hypothetical protein
MWPPWANRGRVSVDAALPFVDGPLERALRDLRDIALGGLCAMFSVHLVVRTEVWIRLTALVADRDTQAPMPLVFETNRPLILFCCASTEQARERLLEFIRDCIREYLRHEADEGISLWGVRVFDPHLPWPQFTQLREAEERNRARAALRPGDAARAGLFIDKEAATQLLETRLSFEDDPIADLVAAIEGRRARP